MKTSRPKRPGSRAAETATYWLARDTATTSMLPYPAGTATSLGSRSSESTAPKTVSYTVGLYERSGRSEPPNPSQSIAMARRVLAKASNRGRISYDVPTLLMLCTNRTIRPLPAS